MIRAWRRADGRYRLDFEAAARERFTWPKYEETMAYSGAEWDPESESWVVTGSALAEFYRYAEKVHGVITGPSSCGCEPAMFRWVTEAEVEAGRTEARSCRPCGERRYHRPGGTLAYVHHQCDIIDVCGEADVAMAVYEAEFRGGVEATR